MSLADATPSCQTEKKIGPAHTFSAVPADFLFHQRPIKPQTVSCEIVLRLFSFSHNFCAASQLRRRTVAFARAMQEAQLSQKGRIHNVGSPQSHPPAQREARGSLGASSIERTLEEKPAARLFGPVWGFLLRRSRSFLKHLVRSSSGAGRQQRKHFAVGESRQALSAAGVPAGFGGLMRNTTQHRETEYFRLFLRCSF